MPSNGLIKFNLAIEKSLLLLEFPVIKFLVICLLVIYNTILIPPFNNVVSQWFRWFWFKLFYLLVIIYVAFKNKTISLLLGISFMLSVQRLNSTERYAPINYNKKELKRVKKAKKIKKIKRKKNKNAIKYYNNQLNNNIIEKIHIDTNIPRKDIKRKQTVIPNNGNSGYNPYIYKCGSPSVTQNEANILAQPITTWNNQISAQGLNCVVGNPGNVDGSTINKN